MIIFAGRCTDCSTVTPSLLLNTDRATGPDYVKFIADVVALVSKDQAALERMANAEGRTLNHPWKGIGAIPTDLE